MDEQNTGQFVTARELNMAVQFLSDKIDKGFTVTHEKQDHTNGRLLRAETDIQDMKRVAFADAAVEKVADKARERLETWKITALSTLGTSALGGAAWLLRKLL